MICLELWLFQDLCMGRLEVWDWLRVLPGGLLEVLGFGRRLEIEVGKMWKG